MEFGSAGVLVDVWGSGLLQRVEGTVLGDTWAALLPDRKVYTAIAQWSEIADGKLDSCSTIMNTMTFYGPVLLYAAIRRGVVLPPHLLAR
jgi:hypothetical protein